MSLYEPHVHVLTVQIETLHLLCEMWSALAHLLGLTLPDLMTSHVLRAHYVQIKEERSICPRAQDR